MKTLHKRVTTFLVALVLLMTGIATFGGIQQKHAEAYENDVNYTSSIYYFSDSEFLLHDGDIATLNDYDYKVYYDYHFLSSAQEFKYLLYTGYFWKFADSSCVTVIIQINSVTLDQQTIDDLFYCLEQQECKSLMIISNDISFKGRSFGNNYQYIECPESNYSIFLRKPFEDYLFDQNGMVKNNSVILIDGRMVGIYETASYRSATLQRLFNYLRFGFNEANIAAFEEGLYGRLWEFYRNNFMVYLGVDESYNKIKRIDILCEAWDTDLEESNSTFWENNREEYEIFEQETITQYYEETYFFDNLRSRDIRVFAHIEGSRFVDLIGMGNCYFNDYSELFDYNWIRR